VNPQNQKDVDTVRNAVLLIKSFVNYDGAAEKLAAFQKQSECQNFWDNTENAVKVMKGKDSIITAIAPIEYLEKRLLEITELIRLAESEGDEALILELSGDLSELARESVTLQIESILSEKHDSANCFLEINAGAGGTEAQDWAEMLARMYSRWAEKKKYKIEIVDKDDGEEAGVKSIRLHIQGNKAYGWLKKESGVHRLVRISPFDSNARRHTSFASALVIPEIDNDIEVYINPSDLRIDTFRSSGPGGQHVNKTESAIRITHIPTGIAVASQIDRSQHRNKEIAMNMLRSKLYAIKLREREESTNSSQPKTDIAWGNQIRSYVLQPYKMVKDSRTGIEEGNALAALDGEIDAFLEAAIAQL
jgi:peptide chain release factor 2